MSYIRAATLASPHTLTLSCTASQSHIMAAVASVLNWLPGMSYMRAVKRRPIELGMRDTTSIEV